MSKQVKVCSVEGCERDVQVKSKGWCKMHWQRWYRNGDPNKVLQIRIADRSDTCSVGGCGLPHKARGWCSKHYSRWLSKGDPLAPVQVQDRLRGATTCEISGCERKHRARGLCATHHQRWRMHGDPNIVLPPNPPVKEKHYAWKSEEEADYMTVHWRLQRNDRAKNHRCSHCKETAKDWAYDHLDPNEKVSPSGAPYSTNPEHYFPLCRGCHKKFDNNQKLSQPAGASTIYKEK